MQNKVTASASQYLQAFINDVFSEREEIQKVFEKQLNKGGRPIDEKTDALILDLLYKGLTPTEISKETGKNSYTVRSSIYAIRRGKGVRSVPQLLALRIKELERSY